MNSQTTTNVLLAMLFVLLGYFTYQQWQFQQIMTRTETVDAIVTRVMLKLDKY